MKTFFLMMSFFTRIPVPKVTYSEEQYRKGMKLMPLVGLVIGIILAALSLLGYFTGSFARGLILLISYVIITGGLHFDGLADTCDGVFSGRERDRILEIMKDSHIGTFGVLSLILVCLSYFVLFTEVPIAALIVFPVVGRAAALVSASMADYARESGMGKTTGNNSGAGELISSAVTVIVSSLITVPIEMFFGSFSESAAGLPGEGSVAGGFLSIDPMFAIFRPLILSLISAIAALILTILLTFYFKKKIGGITGDTLGAVVEVSGIVFLFVYFLL